MSFREKSAWITFLLLLFVFGFYFVSLGMHLIWSEHPMPNFFAVLLVLLLAILVVEVALHILAAMRSPDDAKAPQDERERLVALKAKRPAFFVLMVSAFFSIATVHVSGHFRLGQGLVANGILFSMWLGELTNYGAQLYYYRRGT